MAKSKIDKNIDDMLDVIKMKRIEIAEAEKNKTNTWITHTVFKVGNEPSLDIKQAKKAQVIQALASLYAAECFYNAACETLGIEEEFKYDNYTKAQWETDFKKRINDIDLKAKKESLESAEARFKKIMSEDQRRQQEFDDIMAEFNA